MSAERSAPRRQSRRVALQVLYALDLGQAARTHSPPPPAEVFDRVAANFDLHRSARAFAEELFLGVAAQRDELDALLATHAHNWRVSRMAAVDRNVLRLATYELAHTETPDSVVLNEAIELARDFGSERSPGFVNGVLDAVARALREGRVAEETDGAEASPRGPQAGP